MTSLSSQAFAWPIITLDFEASGLGPETYPIEVGVARWHGPGTGIRMWSSLIQPSIAWRTSGVWKPESVAIHGIERTMLDDAPTPRQVLAYLNRLCPVGTVVFVDGGDYDKGWMQKLGNAAGFNPTALLGSWGHVVSSLDKNAYDRIMEFDVDLEVAHRAGPDARDNLRALAHAIGAPAPATTAWAQCRQMEA